jgi:hypothetical protein
MERWGRFWHIVKLRNKSAFTTDRYISFEIDKLGDIYECARSAWMNAA